MKTNIFGQRLKLLRSTLQLSQKEFAESLSIPQPTVSAYENGKNSPTIDVVMYIADKYNVSIDWLCGRDDNAINHIKMKEKLIEFINDMVGSVDNKDNLYFFHIGRFSSKKPFWTVFACKKHVTDCGGFFCIDKDTLLDDVLSVLIESGWKVEIGNEFYFNFD